MKDMNECIVMSLVKDMETREGDCVLAGKMGEDDFLIKNCEVGLLDEEQSVEIHDHERKIFSGRMVYNNLAIV